MPMMPRKSRGRQKVEMKRMEKDSNRQVTFSKRRAGLFKKASELCTLCGAKVVIIVFSPGNKVYSFGHPNVEAVLDRFLGRSPHQPPNTSSNVVRLLESHRDNAIKLLNAQITEASYRLEMVKRRGEELDRIRRANQPVFWWETPVEELEEPQLMELSGALDDLYKTLRVKAAIAMEEEKRNKSRNSAAAAAALALPSGSGAPNMAVRDRNLGHFYPNNIVPAPPMNLGRFDTNVGGNDSAMNNLGFFNGDFGGAMVAPNPYTGYMEPGLGGFMGDADGGAFNIAPQSMDFNMFDNNNMNMNMMQMQMQIPMGMRNSDEFHGHDGFMMNMGREFNDEYNNNNKPVLGQVPEYDDGRVVGGFQNLLLGNGQYGEAWMDLGGGELPDLAGPELGYQNPYGHGFF